MVQNQFFLSKKEKGARELINQKIVCLNEINSLYETVISLEDQKNIKNEARKFKDVCAFLPGFQNINEEVDKILHFNLRNYPNVQTQIFKTFGLDNIITYFREIHQLSHIRCTWGVNSNNSFFIKS